MHALVHRNTRRRRHVVLARRLHELSPRDPPRQNIPIRADDDVCADYLPIRERHRRSFWVWKDLGDFHILAGSELHAVFASVLGDCSSEVAVLQRRRMRDEIKKGREEQRDSRG